MNDKFRRNDQEIWPKISLVTNTCSSYNRPFHLKTYQVKTQNKNIFCANKLQQLTSRPHHLDSTHPEKIPTNE